MIPTIIRCVLCGAIAVLSEIKYKVGFMLTFPNGEQEPYEADMAVYTHSHGTTHITEKEIDISHKNGRVR